MPKPVEPNLNQGKASRLRLYLSLAIIAIWIIIGFFVFQDIGELIQWFDGLGTLGSIVYCLLITVAIILMAPSPILKVGAGALFPYWIAVLVNFVASIVGGLIAFLLGRWMFRDYIANIVSKDERLKRIETAINNEAMQISVLVRLSPIIPDEWLNYIMASSPVSVRVFFVSSLSSIVYSLAYAYFGLAAGELVFSGNVMENFSNSPAGTILLIIGVVASVIVTFFIARITKNALENKVDVV